MQRSNISNCPNKIFDIPKTPAKLLFGHTDRESISDVNTHNQKLCRMCSASYQWGMKPLGANNTRSVT